MTRRRGWSSGDAAQEAAAEPPKPRTSWSSRPLFDGPAEKARFEDAYKNTPRLEGEDICEWIERANAKARGIGDRELPMRDREVGEEG